jgi:hypothetical protein
MDFSVNSVQICGLKLMKEENQNPLTAKLCRQKLSLTSEASAEEVAKAGAQSIIAKGAKARSCTKDRHHKNHLHGR